MGELLGQDIAVGIESVNEISYGCISGIGIDEAVVAVNDIMGGYRIGIICVVAVENT